MTTAPTTLAPLAGSNLARQALFAVAGSLFLAGLSQISIGAPVPMTLQTLGVFLIGATLGFRLATASVALYLVEGALGLPVFAGFVGGAAHLVGPTGGYLFGFLAAAALIGWAADRGLTRTWIGLGTVLLAGAAMIFALGWAWLGQVIGYDKAFAAGVAPFVLGDLIKVAIAALVAKGVLKGAAGFGRL